VSNLSLKSESAMANVKCLICYEPLGPEDVDYHSRCIKKFFGSPEAPELPYSLDQVYELANQVIRSSVSVTGVQAKLSMDLESYKATRKKTRLTIVGLWGRYVLKPPTENYGSLPEIEDLTMHLAETFGLQTVPHALIRLKSSELAYITRRVDRGDGEKYAMEDMCQLTERLTEDKYKGSLEQVDKIVKTFSDNRGFDTLALFEIAVFSFLCGNADMHLKNFSLLRAKDGSLSLSPAYDLVATKLVLPEDKEEMALTINGKKRNLRKGDFNAFAKALGITDKVLNNSFDRFTEELPNAIRFVDKSFLDASLMKTCKNLLSGRGHALGF
jgi:serine/threonine-protein kinase HipA